MNDTLTPRNDQPTYAMLADMRDRVLLAEAELAAMKEQRDRLAEQIEANHKITLIIEQMVYEAREQRDRLAVALEKAKAVYTPSSKGEYQTGWHDAICWVNQQALQSLNEH